MTNTLTATHTTDRPGAVDGITVSQTGGVLMTGHGIAYFRLLALRSAVKLEALGMRHSRGSMTAMAKRELGVTGNRDKVLAALEAKIEEFRQAHPPTGDGK